MNKNEMYHNERKEYWRDLISRCDASGMNQQEWCQENHVCSTSMSKWRNVIWREEEAEKEFAAAREERAFVEIKLKQPARDNKAVTPFANHTVNTIRDSQQAKPIRSRQETSSLRTPDAVIGYREYMVGVYEHTPCQVLQKVLEVLKYV